MLGSGLGILGIVAEGAMSGISLGPQGVIIGAAVGATAGIIGVITGKALADAKLGYITKQSWAANSEKFTYKPI